MRRTLSGGEGGGRGGRDGDMEACLKRDYYACFLVLMCVGGVSVGVPVLMVVVLAFSLCPVNDWCCFFCAVAVAVAGGLTVSE